MRKHLRIKLYWLAGFLGVILLAQGVYIPVKAQMAQILMQHAWERSQQTNQDIKPWPWADTFPLARLTIPSLAQDFIILGGSSGSSLAFGPGHLTGSALPDVNGHMVLSAHRDTHFADIGKLKIGDTLEIETRTDQIHKYHIYNVRIVNTDNEHLWLDHSENQLTLITCYPFDAIESGGPLRYRIDAYRSI